MDDLISREQVLTLLTERMRDTAFNNVGGDAGEVLVDIVNNRLRRWVNELPLEQKTGKWSRESTPSTMYFYRYRCSVCDWTSEDATKYCCHCGARMVDDE